MFNTPDPEKLIKTIFQAINEKGYITEDHAIRVGRAHGIPDREADDVLSMLSHEGYIEKEGDHYVFTRHIHERAEATAKEQAKKYHLPEADSPVKKASPFADLRAQYPNLIIKHFH